LNLYLGCKHECSTINLPDGTTVNAITYNMEDYLKATVDKYLRLAKEINGAPLQLKQSWTAAIVEDQKDSPMGKPVATGPCITCPWCKFAFPKEDSADPGTQFRKGSQNTQTTTKKSKLKALEEPDPLGGVLQPLAASILMKILYAARMARFDLLYVVSRLACYISKWTPLCDKRLFKIICYINTTLHYRQVGWIGDSMQDLRPHVYADADLAGCAETQRSTTGIHAAIEGPRSCFPICGISKRQGCVSSSTPEAEMIAGHHAYNKVVVPQLDLWEHLFGPTCRGIFHEDNESMIQILRTGRNPTMRQLGRVHRVAIAVMHERLGNPASKDNIDVIHTSSEEMAADIYTKAFANPENWKKALMNINVLDPHIGIEKEIQQRIIQLTARNTAMM